MDLRNQILKEHTKENCKKIVDWVGNDQEKFNELFHLFLDDEYRVTQRAAWPMSYCAIAHPGLMKNNFKNLVGNLNRPNLNDAVKRNTVRLLQSVQIPKKYEGTVMDICFKYIASATEPVAVKAFALTILGNLSRKYPEIIPEIRLLIEDQLPHETAAFKVRAKKLLQENRFN